MIIPNIDDYIDKLSYIDDYRCTYPHQYRTQVVIAFGFFVALLGSASSVAKGTQNMMKIDDFPMKVADFPWRTRNSVDFWVQSGKYDVFQDISWDMMGNLLGGRFYGNQWNSKHDMRYFMVDVRNILFCPFREHVWSRWSSAGGTSLRITVRCQENQETTYPPS